MVESFSLRMKKHIFSLVYSSSTFWIQNLQVPIFTFHLFGTSNIQDVPSTGSNVLDSLLFYKIDELEPYNGSESLSGWMSVVMSVTNTPQMLGNRFMNPKDRKREKTKQSDCKMIVIS